MAYDAEEEKFYMPKRDPKTGDKVKDFDKIEDKDWVTADEAETHSDFQQIFIGGLAKSKHNLIGLSRTEQSMYQSGEGNMTFREGAAIEITDGKIDRDRFVGMSIDDSDQWIRMMRDDDYRKSLPRERRDRLVQEIKKAQATGKLDDRMFEATSVLANYLELEDLPKGQTYRDDYKMKIEKEVKSITLRDSDGIEYNVRVPLNYEPDPTDPEAPEAEVIVPRRTVREKRKHAAPDGTYGPNGLFDKYGKRITSETPPEALEGDAEED